jgi:hypothetical protein
MFPIAVVVPQDRFAQFLPLLPSPHSMPPEKQANGQ